MYLLYDISFPRCSRSNFLISLSIIIILHYLHILTRQRRQTFPLKGNKKKMDFSIALTLVQTILQLLDSSSPFRREIESVWGYKSHLKKLENTMSFIQAVLLEADRGQLSLSFPQQVSLKRLNQVLYHADDLMDEVTTLVERKKYMPGNIMTKEIIIFFSRFNQLIYACSKCREIKKIREILDDIEKDHRQFGSMLAHYGAGGTSHVSSNSRETGSMVCEGDGVVGRDYDKLKVIDKLLDSTIDESVSCISIAGIGGLGKTTLAQVVYNDEKIKREFQLKMWVCVSNDFDIKALLGKILAAATNQPKQDVLGMDEVQKDIQQELDAKNYHQAATNVSKAVGLSMDHRPKIIQQELNRIKYLLAQPKIDGLSVDLLQKYIQQEIDGKKYLLVLDDVWGDVTRKWDKLKEPLIGGGSKGSRIVITTRLANIADTVGGYTYELKGLSEEESWKLFEKMTLKDRVEIKALNGEKILKKCAAVPLAIRVIGSYLRGQGKNKWMHMANTDLASEGNEDIMPVLKISYYDLPLHLKRCFSYCAIFPKDYEINKEELIYLWIAQGFIKSNEQSLEDVGEEYFMNLLERCFFQDVNRADDGEIISCKMHDLIHDVAENLTRTELILLKDNTSNLKAEVCHVFIENEVLQREDTFRFSTQMKRMRTLLRKKYYHYAHRYIDCSVEISKVRNLRVLSWPAYDVKKVPNKIGELMHLRYLDLSSSVFRLLPPSITNLLNLQTLKLRSCRRLEKLPNDLVKLVNLRCLDLLHCNKLTYMPPGMRRMTCLHKLTRFILGNNKRNRGKISGRVNISGLEDLKCLKSLTGTLQIIILGDSVYDGPREGRYLLEMELKGLVIQFASIGENNNAESLLEGLQPNHNLRMLGLVGYPDVRFPNWSFPSWKMRGILSNYPKSCLEDLVEINLFECPRLEYLPCLRLLRKLKKLHLRRLDNLMYVEINNNADGVPMESGSLTQVEADELFQSLQILVLERLPKLKGWGLYSNLFEFPQLNKLTINMCDELTTFPLCHKGREFHIVVDDDSSELLSFYGDPEGTVEINSANVGYIMNSLPTKILQYRPHLAIRKWNDIRRILTGEVFQNGRVPSLLSLEIDDCKELRRLSELGEIRRYIIALEALKLSNLPELQLEWGEDDEDSSIARSRECNTTIDMSWSFLAPTLRHLKLDKLPKLVKLPRGMQHLTSLFSLEIINCHNLEELPTWIDCFTSLHSLRIYRCEKLKSLPQEMCHLTSVQELLLSEELSDADLPKFQHIPNVIITKSLRRIDN